MHWFQSAWHGLKAAVRLRFPGARWGFGWGSPYAGATEYNYARTAATSRGNAAVTAVIRWTCRTVPEAPLQMTQRQPDGDPRVLPDHPAVALLERPNPFYSGLALWNGTLTDYLTSGNAYWLKRRSAAGRVVELWWLPSPYVEPKWPDRDDGPFISHYAYTVDGFVQELPVGDVVHFRDGWDPTNLRKGLSPLASLLREIATDDEAANFTASMLRNLGVPGVVIAPGADVQPTEAELEEVRERFAQRFGGDHRGGPLVLRAPATISVLSFSPEQMQLRDHRRIPEERITAIYGVPAIVVGLGAGLDRSTFANMAEAREAAYESMILPLQRFFLADLQQQYVPDFGDPRQLRLAYDYSTVRVLQADQNALMDRVVKGYQGGVLTRGEARVLVGQDSTPADALFSTPGTMTLAARTEGVPPPKPAPAPPPALPPPPPADGGKAAPFVGVFTAETLAAAERLGGAAGLGPLLDVPPPASNGHA